MTSYKTVYIPTRQEFKGSMDKISTHRVDGLGMATEIQALLYEYEEKGFELVSMETVNGGRSGLAHTQGFIVVLRKMER